MLTNLISNAIKYSPDGGDITITCEENESFVTVTVTDNGIGIPTESLSKVLDSSFGCRQNKMRTSVVSALDYILPLRSFGNTGAVLRLEVMRGMGRCFVSRFRGEGLGSIRF